MGPVIAVIESIPSRDSRETWIQSWKPRSMALSMQQNRPCFKMRTYGRVGRERMNVPGSEQKTHESGKILTVPLRRLC